MVCPHDATVVVDAAHDPLVGQSVGVYTVKRRIGVGGTGALYEAEEPNIGKRVALKVVHPHYSANPLLPTLLAEAKAVNAIGDRGIVDIFGFGTLPDGRQYLVMELLQGEALDVMIRKRGKLPVQEAIAIAIPILHALQAAHAAGFIHRDLKPSNLFVVTPKNGAPYPKVLDFGLAQRDMQTSDVVLGTPDYIAPEQAAGLPANAQSDLYSFGCTLYEMLTGAVPFDAPTPKAIVKLHTVAPRPRVKALRPEVPDALDQLVLKLMQVQPSDRPKTAAEVETALHKLVPRSKAWLVGPVAVVVALAATVFAVMAWKTPTTVEKPNPLAAAVHQAEQKVIDALAAGDDSALDRLRAAEAAYPGRREWPALHGQLVEELRARARRELAAGEADLALATLSKLGPSDGGVDALSEEARRAQFASRNGMVRVGEHFIDAYEYPNKPGAKPAVKVDWAEAQKLCTGAGKHLCSEDEWAKACHGFEVKRCRHKDKKLKGPAAAGAFADCRSPEGAFDLSGNVAEWTSSPPHEGAPQRVIKGGSFFQADDQLACDARAYFLPGLGGAAHIGFRCCL
ncbi:MAG: bifunctional serine/threonine-protein kinase/formylglycine-generating enzyme family protein [Myxococcaceae bacterium]